MGSMNPIYLNKFKQTFTEFIDEIRIICEVESDYDNIVKQNELVSPETSLKQYYQQCNNRVNDFSSQNAIIFDKDNELLTDINLYYLWNLHIDDATREGVWKYLFTLYLYSYLCIENKELGEIIKKYKKIDPSQIGESQKNIYAVIDRINNEKRI